MGYLKGGWGTLADGFKKEQGYAKLGIWGASRRPRVEGNGRTGTIETASAKSSRTLLLIYPFCYPFSSVCHHFEHSWSAS